MLKYKILAFYLMLCLCFIGAEVSPEVVNHIVPVDTVQDHVHQKDTNHVIHTAGHDLVLILHHIELRVVIEMIIIDHVLVVLCLIGVDILAAG